MFLKGSPVISSHKSDGLLAPAGIRFADDGGLFHPGKLIKNLLNFTRVNVDAVDQEHVLLAVGDEIIAIGIPVTDVAGEQPPVTENFGGLFRLVPITKHYV